MTRRWFQTFFFTPTWGNDPLWRTYFSNGLVQPPTRWHWKIPIQTPFATWNGTNPPTSPTIHHQYHPGSTVYTWVARQLYSSSFTANPPWATLQGEPSKHLRFFSRIFDWNWWSLSWWCSFWWCFSVMFFSNKFLWLFHIVCFFWIERARRFEVLSRRCACSSWH